MGQVKAINATKKTYLLNRGLIPWDRKWHLLVEVTENKTADHYAWCHALLEEAKKKGATKEKLVALRNSWYEEA